MKIKRNAKDIQHVKMVLDYSELVSFQNGGIRLCRQLGPRVVLIINFQKLISSKF